MFNILAFYLLLLASTALNSKRTTVIELRLLQVAEPFAVAKEDATE